MNKSSNNQSFAALKVPEIRYMIGSAAFFTLANRAMFVIVGLQIYKLTNSALALGLLGLVQAIPALSLSLYGGYVADRFNRRNILIITKIVSVICAILLAVLSLNGHQASVVSLFAVVFLAGIARGFGDPAGSAFEAQVVPKHLTMNASSWIGSVVVGCSVIGPGAVGFIYEAVGIVNTYLIMAATFAASFLFTLMIKPKPMPVVKHHESLKESVSAGLKFVFNEQALVGAMTLDLFAVFFGGAVALLPIFATDILHVGARGLGLMEAAPALGALLVMLISTRHPPIHHAGRNLLICVAGFGVSIIIFALSHNFILTLVALFASGLFDGISMVIRRSTIRLLSPDHMRGRIASVSWIFIGASNELGALESGIAAHLLGAVPAVWVGGFLTLLIVGTTALRAPKLRQLRFDPQTMQRL